VAGIWFNRGGHQECDLKKVLESGQVCAFNHTQTQKVKLNSFQLPYRGGLGGSITNLKGKTYERIS